MHNFLESLYKAFSNLFFPLFIVGLVAWVGGFSYYNYYIVNLEPDKFENIDATIVLTGGSGRVEKGIKLLADGSSDHLFISGVGANVKSDDLTKKAPDGTKVDLGYEASNTRQNAEESIAWIQKNGYKSIRLITSYYHVPRSMLEFHEEMPDLIIYIYPVRPEFFQNKSRVSSFKKALVLFTEYNKLLRVIARISLYKIRNLII